MMEVSSFITDAGILNDKKYLVCCGAALARSGLTTVNAVTPTVFTSYKELNNKSFYHARFVYTKRKLDYESHLTPSQYNDNILIPDQQRAIVEAILDIGGTDEGELIEALKYYIEYGDMESLYAVADEFGLPKETLTYWLDEARNDFDE